MRAALGALVNVPAEDIILGNSTSYGLHLLANGLPWRADDDLLLVDGDYPADILPWLALRRQGVRVRFIQPRGAIPRPDEVAAALTPATRLSAPVQHGGRHRPRPARPGDCIAIPTSEHI